MADTTVDAIWQSQASFVSSTERAVRDQKQGTGNDLIAKFKVTTDCASLAINFPGWAETRIGLAIPKRVSFL